MSVIRFATAFKDKVYRHLRPKKYEDFVPYYEEYEVLQKGQFCSFESEVPKWEEGQKRFISMNFTDVDKTKSILDIACGDGVGLRCFRENKFADVTGVEFNQVKAIRAEKAGYPVIEADMHELSCFKSNSFDIVYSSHSIEHAYRPAVAISEMVRVLRKGGSFIVVLPYPDVRPESELAHGARYELGSYIEDLGEAVTTFFERLGVRLISKQFDEFREPEIWLRFEKPAR